MVGRRKARAHIARDKARKAVDRGADEGDRAAEDVMVAGKGDGTIPLRILNLCPLFASMQGTEQEA